MIMPYSFWTWTLIPSYEKTPRGICSSCTLNVMNTATSALLTKKTKVILAFVKWQQVSSFIVRRPEVKVLEQVLEVVCSFPSLFDINSFFQSGPQSLTLFPSAIVSRIFSCRMLNLHNVLCECCDVILTVSACHQKEWCQNPSLYGREIPGTWLAILLLDVRLVVWIFTPFQRPK